MPKQARARISKKEKDPNAPKKYMGAYMWFTKVKREDVKKEHPDVKVTEIMKILGGKWRELTDDDKKEFQAMADDDKKRYEKEIAAYKAKSSS